jgi:hypothetical protein
VFEQLYDPFSDDVNHTFHLQSLFLFANDSETLSNSHPAIVRLARQFEPYLRKLTGLVRVFRFVILKPRPLMHFR